MNNKIKVALVRGDSLNEWEGKLWEEIGSDFSVEAFCSHKNLYKINNLHVPVERLRSSTDSFFASKFDNYFRGIFQKMNGLEKKLTDFDIVHTAELSYFFTTQAVRAKKFNSKLKVATTIWDNSFGRFEYNYWPGFKNPPLFWRKKINKIIQENINGVDLFLPVTDYSAQMLLDYGVTKDKIRIITPAVIAPPVTNMLPTLAELKLEDKNFFVSVCRLVKEKGVYDILYAWRMYMKQPAYKNEKLLFVGNGKERDNLIRLAHDFGIASSVLFVKSMPNHEVRNLYKHAKALILASLPGSLWQEQFGYVLAESICAGCPVVSTYSGAIPEVIENAGLLFSPGNPVDLKDRLLMLNDRMRYEELQRNCDVVKNKFSVKNFTNNLVSAYKELYD